MPKITRKYPTKAKTTTREGRLEYQKLQMRDYRERQKAEYDEFNSLFKTVVRTYGISTEDLLKVIDLLDEKNFAEGTLFLKSLLEQGNKIMVTEGGKSL